MAGLFLSFVFRKFSLPVFRGVGGRTGISNHLIWPISASFDVPLFGNIFFSVCMFSFLPWPFRACYTEMDSWPELAKRMCRKTCRTNPSSHQQIRSVFVCMCVPCFFLFFSTPLDSVVNFCARFFPHGLDGLWSRSSSAFFLSSSALLYSCTAEDAENALPRKLQLQSSWCRVDGKKFSDRSQTTAKRGRERQVSHGPFPPILFHWEWRHYISCNFFFLCCPFVEMYWKESRAEYDVISIGPISPRDDISVDACPHGGRSRSSVAALLREHPGHVNVTVSSGWCLSDIY